MPKVTGRAQQQQLNEHPAASEVEMISWNSFRLFRRSCAPVDRCLPMYNFFIALSCCRYAGNFVDLLTLVIDPRLRLALSAVGE